jgi:hypothetical protein
MLNELQRTAGEPLRPRKNGHLFFGFVEPFPSVAQFITCDMHVLTQREHSFGVVHTCAFCPRFCRRRTHRADIGRAPLAHSAARTNGRVRISGQGIAPSTGLRPADPVPPVPHSPASRPGGRGPQLRIKEVFEVGARGRAASPTKAGERCEHVQGHTRAAPSDGGTYWYVPRDVPSSRSLLSFPFKEKTHRQWTFEYYRSLVTR